MLALDVRMASGASQRLRVILEKYLPGCVLLVALCSAPSMIFSSEGLPRLRGLERELDTVDSENRALGRQIDELRGHVERLRDDPAAVERIARDDLGLVRQSEVVFQFAGKPR